MSKQVVRVRPSEVVLSRSAESIILRMWGKDGKLRSLNKLEFSAVRNLMVSFVNEIIEENTKPPSLPFNEDMIRRDGLPKDVFGLIHDLCYHHDGRDVYNYVRRAQEILKTPRPPAETKTVIRDGREVKIQIDPDCITPSAPKSMTDPPRRRPWKKA